MNGQIQSIVARIERLEDEKKTISTDIAEVYKEAKANGFDVKVLRKVIAKRKKSAVERSEEEAMIDVYMASLGMVPDSNIEISRRDGVNVTYSRAKTKPVERLASDHGAAAEVSESHSAAAIQSEHTDHVPDPLTEHAGGVEAVPSLDASPAAPLEELPQSKTPVLDVAKADAARIDQSEPISVAMMSVEDRGASAAPFDDDLTIPDFLKRAGNPLRPVMQANASGV